MEREKGSDEAHSGGEKIECNVGGSCEGREPANFEQNVKVGTRKLYYF